MPGSCSRAADTKMPRIGAEVETITGLAEFGGKDDTEWPPPAVHHLIVASLEPFHVLQRLEEYVHEYEMIARFLFGARAQ